VVPDRSHVLTPQHLGCRLVQTIRPPYRFEAREKVLDAKPPPLSSAKVVDDVATVHHHDAIADVDGPTLVSVTGDYRRR